MDRIAVENITKQLESQRKALKSLREEYAYLEKTHKNLFIDIESTMNKVDNFYEQHNLLTRTFITSTKEIKGAYKELQSLMAAQEQQMLAVNDSVTNLAEQYNAPKEAVTEMTKQLQEYAKLQKNIEKFGSNSSYGQDLEKQLHNLENSITSSNLGLEMLSDYIDNNNSAIAKHLELENSLVETVNDLAKAQNNVTDALDEAYKKGEKFKKSGWLDALSGLWSGVKVIAQASYDKMKEVDQAGHDFGRNLGMTTSDINKHTTSLYDNYANLAGKLGMEYKDMYKFQVQYAEVTEKATILSMNQVGAMASISRNVGEEAVSVASKNLDVFTTSADATIEYLAKGTARAALEGLNVKKYSEAFANNIKMASKYTFKEGITGIQKMTLLSQRLKFNLESIGTAMDKFSTLEGAIEASAKIQVLGGQFAQNFGNPLQAMSDALLDAEGFTKRIINTVASQAKFNSQTGEIDLAPIDKQRLKAYSEALGISYDEIHNMATQSRRSKEIERIVGGGEFSEEDIAYLSNKSQYNKETKKWELIGVDGNAIVQDITVLTQAQLKEIKSTDTHEKMLNATVRDIKNHLVDNATAQLSQGEREITISEQIKLTLGKQLDSLDGWFKWILAGIAALEGIGVLSSITKTVGGLATASRKMIPSSTSSGGGGLMVGARNSYISRDGRTFIARSSNVVPQARSGQVSSHWINKANSLKSGGTSWGSKVAGKASGLLTLGLAGYQMYSASQDYDDQIAAINASNMSGQEKAVAKNEAQRNRNKSYGSSAGGALGSIAAGTAAGAIFGPIGMLVGSIAGGILGSTIGKSIGDVVTEDIESVNEENGSVDEQTNGESIIADKLGAIQGFVSSINSNVDDIKGVTSALWKNNYGGNVSSIYYNPNVRGNIQEIKVSDIKVNVGGNIKLEGRTNSIDVDNLLQNPTFKECIVGIVRNHINSAVNGKTTSLNV